jgi:hypothetical protein
MKGVDDRASEGEMAEFPSSEHSMFTNKRTTDFEQFKSGQSIVWLARLVVLSDPFSTVWVRFDTGMVTLDPGRSVSRTARLELFTPSG